MKSKCFLSVLCILIISLCSCLDDRNLPKDIKGWHNTTWGMSLSEIKKLYPTLEQSGDSYLCKIDITEYPYDVYFHFGSTGKLDTVDLYSDFHRIFPDVDLCDISQNAYDDVVEQLKQKYGNPTKDKKPKENNGNKFIWEYPSTIIESTSVTKIYENFCPYSISFKDNRRF